LVSQIDRKARKREYKETPRPAGVYRVRNTATGKSLVGSTADLPGMLNRQRFQLENGSHPDRELQSDWNELGPGAFEFEVLDQLKPQGEPAYDPTEDLRVLKEMWLEKFTAAGEPLYSESRRGT
jgi:hypothetical protein